MSIVTTFSDALISARRSGEPFTPRNGLPENHSDAYAIQSAVAAAFGQTGAFKVGLQDPGPALVAPIRADLCLPSGSTVAVRRLAVELEVGWLVTGPLPPKDAPDRRARLAAAVRPVPVIELVESRVAGEVGLVPPVRLADALLNWGLIVGTPLQDWDGSDFGRVSGRMQVGEALLLDGETSVPGGSALASLEALIDALGEHCGGLREGQIVITGTLHPMTWIEADQEVRGEIDGLGAVAFSLRRPA